MGDGLGRRRRLRAVGVRRVRSLRAHHAVGDLAEWARVPEHDAVPETRRRRGIRRSDMGSWAHLRNELAGGAGEGERHGYDRHDREEDLLSREEERRQSRFRASALLESRASRDGRLRRIVRPDARLPFGSIRRERPSVPCVRPPAKRNIVRAVRACPDRRPSLGRTEPRDASSVPVDVARGGGPPNRWSTPFAPCLSLAPAAP